MAATNPLRRLARRKRLARAIVVVSLVGLALAASLWPYPPWAWRSGEIRPLRIAFDYPRSWSAQPFDNDLKLATHTGVVIASVDHEFRYPDLGPGARTSAWEMRDVPDDAVVVEISRVPRFPVACEETTRFPLPGPTAPPTRHPPSYGAPPKYTVGACIEGRPPFYAHVYFFPHAPRTDQLRAWQVVGSITPER